MENDLHTINADDISRALDISLRNAYRLMRRPDFPAIRVSPRRIVVPEAAFKQWLEDQVAAKRTQKLG